MIQALLTIIVALFTFLSFQPNIAYAADCMIVYGGGKTDCVVTPTPMPQPTATPVPQPATQSKGGLPIQPVSNAKTAPNTGPEELSLLSLVPMAAAGFYLRKKTK